MNFMRLESSSTILKFLPGGTGNLYVSHYMKEEFLEVRTVKLKS